MSDELILNIGRQSLLLRYHDCGPDSEFIINGKEIVCSTCGEVLGPVSLVMYPQLKTSTLRESIIHRLGKFCLAYRLSGGYYSIIIDPYIRFRVHIQKRTLTLQGRPVARPDALIPIPWGPIFIEYERGTWRNHKKTATYRTVLYRIVAKNLRSLNSSPLYEENIEPILVLAVNQRAKKIANIYKRLGWNVIFLNDDIIQDIGRVIYRIRVPSLTPWPGATPVAPEKPEITPGQASQEHADQPGTVRLCAHQGTGAAPARRSCT